ncbi:MAG: ABC transporter permease [Anaerolineae bacterium]|nr:ABC transporter permease [Thermoflexales bacterium]MDW8408358.1 ABC transporter permease [Anaerolineae bacterium]
MSEAPSSARRSRLFLGPGWLLTVALLTITLASWFGTPHPPNAMNVPARLQPPSWTHLAGTDEFGRDLFSRLMAGGRISLAVGLGAMTWSVLAGMLIGMLAGYFGGWLDDVLMRLMDALMALPGIVIALLIVAVRGVGFANTALALGLMGTPVIARVTRSAFLVGREMEYVLAARALGASSRRVILMHILPNQITPLLVAASINLAAAILGEAGLSYLGLGTQPPDPSWGRMLQEAQRYIGVAWWYALAPGLTITVAVFAFYLLANDLQRSVSRSR